jgi:hypothetical protein
MGYGRDPLSETYDAAAARLVRRALARPRQWCYTTVTRPAGRSLALAWIREHGIPYGTDAGGLTAWERAYQRAAYYYFDHLEAGKPGGELSLQREWGPATVRGRLLGVRVGPRETARRAAARKPKSERWVDNPRLESGGEGSGKRTIP